jgi:hypothetical protein
MVEYVGNFFIVAEKNGRKEKKRKKRKKISQKK